MIIAVAAVGMMQVVLYQVVNVLAMRHGFMAAVLAMNVAWFVGAARVFRGAGIRVCLVHIDLAFIDVIAVDRVKVAVMKVVDMVFMPDGGMPAPRTMNVLMIR